jgi:glycerol uptake facilitator protein
MTPVIGEFIGTILLITLGTGVVANVLLSESKGQNSGWIVITLGWAMAVFIGNYVCVKLGGSGHLNPAFTLGAALFTDFDQALVFPYLLAQFGGAMLGATLTWMSYYSHFEKTTDAALKLAVFCNAPAIRKTIPNLITEIIATAILVIAALGMSQPKTAFVTIDALPIALVVLAIGLCMGGPTGYAINPARDLGPRIAHFLLPIQGKGHSDWSYSWIPVIGPLLGALLGFWIYGLL